MSMYIYMCECVSACECMLSSGVVGGQEGGKRRKL